MATEIGVEILVTMKDGPGGPNMKSIRITELRKCYRVQLETFGGNSAPGTPVVTGGLRFDNDAEFDLLCRAVDMVRGIKGKHAVT